MEKLLMCRICLTTDIRSGSILKPHLQDTYEKLTAKKFETKDSRPILTCYLCCARLQNCYQLSMNCLRSEELLTQIISGKMLNPGNLQNITQKTRLGITPVVVETFGDSHHFDLDASGKSSSEFEGVDVEMKVVVNQVLEENVPEEKIKEEPVLEDAFQYVEPEDEIPLDIVKHEIGTFPSIFMAKKPTQANQQNTTSSNFKQTEIVQGKVNEITKIPGNTVPRNKIIKNCDKVEISENKKSITGVTSPVKQQNRDMSSSNTNKLCGCSICKKYFSSKYTLKRHIRIHTGKKPYRCDVCTTCFSAKSSLKSHMRKHNGEKPYQCDVCRKCFSIKAYFTGHMRTHTGEKPYRCEMCQKCFSGKSNFTCHVRTHTGEKPYQCKICKKCFAVKGALTSHIRTHSGEKPYQCDQCKKRFTEKHMLTIHIRLHTGEKPFKCNMCKKCFAQKSALIRHIRTHTGERPFKCNVCEKCFPDKGYLSHHARTHTGEEPYQCNICNKRFKYSSQLTNHVRTHIGDEKPHERNIIQFH